MVKDFVKIVSGMQQKMANLVCGELCLYILVLITLCPLH